MLFYSFVFLTELNFELYFYLFTSFQEHRFKILKLF